MKIEKFMKNNKKINDSAINIYIAILQLCCTCFSLIIFTKVLHLLYVMVVNL